MTNPYNESQLPDGQYRAAQFAPAPAKKTWSTKKKVAVGAGAAVVAIIAINAGNSDKTTTTTTLADGTTVTATSEAAKGPKTSFGPGIYLVGTQIEAGTYQAPGGKFCYYERRSNTSSDFDGIIANEAATDNSQQIVTIDPTDKAFKSQGCGTWQKIG